MMQESDALYVCNSFSLAWLKHRVRVMEYWAIRLKMRFVTKLFKDFFYKHTVKYIINVYNLMEC